MTGQTNWERAKERAVASFKRLRNVKDAAIESRVPISSLRSWLKEAGIPFSEPVSRERVSPSRQPDHRDPCPKCNTRKDIGCKHFPKQPEAQRPMTDRERAEAMWSKQV